MYINVHQLLPYIVLFASPLPVRYIYTYYYSSAIQTLGWSSSMPVIVTMYMTPVFDLSYGKVIIISQQEINFNNGYGTSIMGPRLAN